LSSVILTVICSCVALALAVISMRRVLTARTRWEQGHSRTPIIVRWLWAAGVACCALTCGLLVAMALFNVASRGTEGAVEGSLAARVAIYTGVFGYGIAWMQGRVRVNWPALRKPGPLLLPPAPDEGQDDDGPDR